MATAVSTILSDQRREPRVAADFPAELLAYRYHRDVRVLDLSCNGAMVQLDDPPRRGEELLFKKGLVEVVATVAWTRRDTCGIAFHRPVELDWLLKKGRATRGIA